MSQKDKKPKAEKPVKPGADDRRRVLRRSVAWLVAVGVVACGTVIGLKHLEQRILEGKDGSKSQSVRVTLAERPQWMPAALADDLARELLPSGADYRQADLAKRVYERARANPWIRRVRVAAKRGRDDKRIGVIEVHAEYRKPLARVLGPDGYYRFVDGEGFVLPPLQVPRWVVTVPAREGKETRQICYVSSTDVPDDQRARPIHYVTVKGVDEPSPGVGRKWPGDDVGDGLKLAKLVAAKSYANQIPMADVHNWPLLRMYAQIRSSRRTEILFGRFPQPGGDYVVPTQRKLSYLDTYVAENGGRLAGLNRCLDLRLDQLYVTAN